MVNSLLSSELVYKVLDGSETDAIASFEEMRAGLPASSTTLQQVQWSLPHVSQRYASLHWTAKPAVWPLITGLPGTLTEVSPLGSKMAAKEICEDRGLSYEH